MRVGDEFKRIVLVLVVDPAGVQHGYRWLPIFPGSVDSTEQSRVPVRLRCIAVKYMLARDCRFGCTQILLRCAGESLV